MNIINIAIIEEAPLARAVLEDVLSKANFNVIVSADSIDYFLDKAKERLMDSPDICLLDSTVKVSSINAIKKYYPETKIAVYDPIATREKNALHVKHFDVYMSRSLKLEQWITVLQDIIRHQKSTV